MSKNNYNKAIIDFDKVIELDENFVNAYINRGICYYQINKYDNALNNINKLINEKKYKKNEIYLLRGLCLYYKKMVSKSIDDFKKVINDKKYIESIPKDIINKLKKESII